MRVKDFSRFSEPWAMRLESLEFIQMVIANGSELEIKGQIEPEAKSAKLQGTRKSIAMMKLSGMFDKGGGWGLDTERVQSVFNSYARDENIGGILLHIDSPGGSAFGIEELAGDIIEARKAKPVVAVADGLMASAAYWLGASASKLVATPSSLLGSIGVYMMHMDMSKMLEQAGVKPTFISAGKFKTEGNEFEPLSDAAREHTQSLVDSYYTKFVKAVSKGRNVSVATVRQDFGQGRVVTAEEAVRVGMADEVGSVESALSGLASQVGVVGARAADQRRRQFALTKQVLGV